MKNKKGVGWGIIVLGTLILLFLLDTYFLGSLRIVWTLTVVGTYVGLLTLIVGPIFVFYELRRRRKEAKERGVKQTFFET